MEISDDKIGETILQEALKCLYQTIEEGEKTSDVDIEAMLTNVERSRQLLQKKLEVEIIPFYKDILLQLVETLSSHEEVLKTKIKQLNLCNIDASGDACFGKTMCHKVDPQLTGRRAAIEETIVRENGLGMSDIAGLLEAKQALREAIIMPLQFPNLFTGGIQPWRRILLYGPPGTGKSRLAQALSSEIKSSSFYCVSSSDLVSSWVGESEKLIKELFSHATQQQSRSVIFIDEIDSICRQRTSREEEYTRRIKTELLRQMEGADNEGKSGKIFLLCATNCPWELDSAFLRRFQKRIYVPLPDLEARLELLKIHTRENGIIFSEDNWLALGHATEGFSGSDLANMILDALMQPIRELHHTTCWKQTDAGMFEACKTDTVGSFNKTMNELPVEKIKPRKITLEDFLSSSRSHRKTVTAEELLKFNDFTHKMGEHGS